MRSILHKALATRMYLWLVLCIAFARSFPLVASSKNRLAQPHSTRTIETKLHSSTLRRVKESLTSKERTHEELKLGIAGFYDRSSKLWENVWGEHMHHVSSGALCVSNDNTHYCYRGTTYQPIEQITSRRRWI